MSQIARTASLPARRVVFLGSLAALAGCALKPVTLDRATMADVKRVGLPTPGFPKQPVVDVTRGIGKSFGAIGLLTTAIVEGNRADAVADLIANQSFDPQAYFQQQVAARLQQRGLVVVPQAASPARQEFIKDYAPPGDNDAILDVYVSGYGFIAFSDSDDSPYRPAVSVTMRLVQAADRSILMQDKLTNAGIDAKADGTAAPAFVTFSAVTDNPQKAIAALRYALAYAADGIGKRLA